MIKVVDYERVSTDEDEQLYALRHQIEMIRNYINEQSEWELIDSYVDEGKSGTTSKGRKEYERLYNDLLTDKFDIVVIKDETRLSRNPLTWYLFIDRLIKNKKRLFFLNTNSFYNPDEEFMMSIKAGMAAQFSRDLSKKVNLGHKHRQKQGVVITNGKMWGYRQLKGKLMIDEQEAEIVIKIFKWYIDGLGFRTIQKKLTDEGILTRTGQPFSLTTLKRMIKNEKYKGVLISNKKHKDFNTKEICEVPQEEWIIHNDIIPPIITEEVWNQANEVLNGKKKENVSDEEKNKVYGYFQGSYLYSGKIICDECGRPYWHQKYKKMKHDMWQCSGYREFGKNNPNGCSNNHIYTYVLDKIVKEAVFMAWEKKEDAILSTIEALNEALKQSDYNSPVKKLIQNKISLNKKKDNLIDLLSEELINKDEYKKKKYELDNEIKMIEEQINLFEEENKDLLDKKSRMEKLKHLIGKQSLNKEAIDEELIKATLSKIVIKKDNELEIYINPDKAYHVQNFNGDYIIKSHQSVSAFRQDRHPCISRTCPV